ncbi:MAG: hypothetical protein WCQ77_12140 [Planctomycetota bacterium]
MDRRGAGEGGSRGSGDRRVQAVPYEKLRERLIANGQVLGVAE